MNPTREERKKLGKQVVYSYFLLNNGHATVASVKFETDLIYGISLCSPTDNFCRKEGRILARKRLFHYMGRIIIKSIEEDFQWKWVGKLPLNESEREMSGNSGELNKRVLIQWIQAHKGPQWTTDPIISFKTRARNRLKHQLPYDVMLSNKIDKQGEWNGINYL